jgi:hypothetical protein
MCLNWSSQKTDFEFKRNNPDQVKRKNQSANIILSYPDKVPIICEKAPGAKINDIDKTKFLVGNELRLIEFIDIIRARLNLEKDSALFIIIGGKHCVSTEMNIGEIYKKYQDPEDGFLYMHYSSELTFGH